MHRRDIDTLDPAQGHWVPAVVSPERNWCAAPGCCRGARFLVNATTLRPSREEFDTFDTRLDCLQWVMRHRPALNRSLPGGTVRAVRLDRWLLGLE